MRLYELTYGEMEEVEKTNLYEDLGDDWYTQTVSVATRLGFVQGSVCGKGRCFNAYRNISRAEASTILHRMFFEEEEEEE
jgi:hypothetical protein